MSKPKKKITQNERNKRFIYIRTLKAIILTMLLLVLLGALAYALELVKSYIPRNSGNLKIGIFVFQVLLIFFPAVLISRIYSTSIEHHFRGMGKVRHAQYIALQQELYHEWYGSNSEVTMMIPENQLNFEKIIDKID